MAALCAALRTFGIELGSGKLIIAYSTGYAATRRSLPLGGAGVTEALMTYALYWVREPLAPALAAVLLYRVLQLPADRGAGGDRPPAVEVDHREHQVLAGPAAACGSAPPRSSSATVREAGANAVLTVLSASCAVLSWSCVCPL